jgi:hypothetical protein
MRSPVTTTVWPGQAGLRHGDDRDVFESRRFSLALRAAERCSSDDRGERSAPSWMPTCSFLLVAARIGCST